MSITRDEKLTTAITEAFASNRACHVYTGGGTVCVEMTFEREATEFDKSTKTYIGAWGNNRDDKRRRVTEADVERWFTEAIDNLKAAKRTYKPESVDKADVLLEIMSQYVKHRFGTR